MGKGGAQWQASRRGLDSSSGAEGRGLGDVAPSDESRDNGISLLRYLSFAMSSFALQFTQAQDVFSHPWLSFGEGERDGPLSLKGRQVCMH